MTTEIEREKALQLAKAAGFSVVANEINITDVYSAESQNITEEITKLIELTRAEALEEAAAICDEALDEYELSKLGAKIRARKGKL